MNIGSVARVTGLPAKTIRYYETAGLISPPARAENGYRQYQKSDIETLNFIVQARQLGFSIKDVANLLELWNDRERASVDVKEMTLKQIDKIDQKISELQAVRATLTNLAERCHGDDRPDCPILDKLETGE